MSDNLGELWHRGRAADICACTDGQHRLWDGVILITPVQAKAETGQLIKRLLEDHESVVQYDALFELQHRRLLEANERWRAENPADRALQMEDLGALLEWLHNELYDTVGALRDLFDEQNGPPLQLERHRRSWDAAMLRAAAVLDRLDPLETQKPPGEMSQTDISPGGEVT